MVWDIYYVILGIVWYVVYVMVHSIWSVINTVLVLCVWNGVSYGILILTLVLCICKGSLVLFI